MTFDEILNTYGATIRRIAASYAPPGAGREDLEQEILLQVYQAMPRWREESQQRTYVYRIAQNCGIRSLKNTHKQRAREPWDDQITHPADAETSLQQARQYERLASCVRQLPLNQRLPLILRLEGLSYDEIATILELSVNTVGVRLHRATQTLKALMEKS